MTSQRALQAVKDCGVDAMSFLTLESGMRHWFDDEGPQATGACVAYVDTGGAWVAATGPLGAPRDLSRIAGRFVRAATAAGRRASIFGTETASVDGFAQLLLGQQPIFRPRQWLEQLAGRRSLREQLRRARAKGVSIRHVTARELVEGAPMRVELERLAKEWLASRHMAPMQFLVAVELFVHPRVHLYFVAEHQGRVVALLSAVPIYHRRGWLVEDVIRSDAAPNGTTELLFYALMLQVCDTCDLVTLGLTPLSGQVPQLLWLAGKVGRTFFDFEGLRAFRERLGPQHWQSVWMLWPRGSSPFLHVMDSLRAFAGGSLLRFGARSLLRHPGGPPWLLAVPLVPWTLALIAILAVGHADWLGFQLEQLSAWSAFDVMLIAALFRVAARPTPIALVLVALAAAVDAALSVTHLRAVGLGSSGLEGGLRFVATAAPCLAVALLAWAWLRAISRHAACVPQARKAVARGNAPKG